MDYKQMCSLMPHGILVVRRTNGDLTVEYANKKLEDITAGHIRHAIGKLVSELWPHGANHPLILLWAQPFKAGETREADGIKYPTENGDRYFDFSCYSPEQDVIVTIATDVTKSMSLRESVGKLNGLVSQLKEKFDE